MKGEAANSTIYRLPRSRLKREHHCLDWIDDYESMTVDVEFCNWLAERDLDDAAASLASVGILSLINP